MLRIIFAVLAVGLALLCAFLFAEVRRDVPAISAAGDLMARPRLWRNSADLLEGYLASVGSRKDCDPRFDRSLAILELARADLLAAPSNADPTRVRIAQETALTRVRHALRCAPQDGATWLYAAMLEAALGEPPTTVARSLELSALITPYDAAVLMQRIRFVGSLQGRGLPGVEAIFERDLLTLAKWGCLADLEAVAGALPPPAAALMRIMPMAGIEPRRRKIIQNAGRTSGG
ncbi:hypothetical protein [Jiella pacifica]|uniref:Uncharacterized protein n=1 Tax=Jiella pacifica TaxID=2696469 RepID=A0A6N9T1A3_9HYPH|nr:hypothetical protein [Jiella pacifica]NDW04362.1 hypothetical protein [Jiella pacifica]